MKLWAALTRDAVHVIPETHHAEFWREVAFINRRRVRGLFIFLMALYPPLMLAVNWHDVLQLSAADNAKVFAMHCILFAVAVLSFVSLSLHPPHSPEEVTPRHEKTLWVIVIGSVAGAFLFIYIITVTKGHPIFFYLNGIIWFSSLLMPPRRTAWMLAGMLLMLWAILIVCAPAPDNLRFTSEGYISSLTVTIMLFIGGTQLFQRTAEGFAQRKLIEEERNTIAQLNSELAIAYEEADTLNQELKERQDILEQQAQEIEIMNTQLQEQNQTLVELNNEKDEFLGIAAHDLKNPLNGIRGLAEMLHSYDDEIPVAERKRYLESIIASSERMFGLIKNLLDVNALERAGLQLNPVTLDAASMVSMIADSHRYRAEQKNITLHLASSTDNSSALVRVDEQALIQVLDNLLSNAVKYSPQGKQVFVRVESGAEAVRIEVEDEGPGISAEDQQKLFGKFARLSAQPTGGEHSTGLGLSIVKKLVEAMGGMVWCESALGKGTTFVVELPSMNKSIEKSMEKSIDNTI
jgi:signal transduction histidine kinase